MFGFRELSKKFQTGLGVGRLLSVWIINTHQPIIADDLLNPEDIEAIAFHLEHCIFYCLAKGKDDQLEIYLEQPFQSPDLVKLDISSQQPWATVMGAELFDIWSLQTLRGDYDALQFTFGSIDDPKHLIIQIEVVASRFTASTVNAVLT